MAYYLKHFDQIKKKKVMLFVVVCVCFFLYVDVKCRGQVKFFKVYSKSVLIQNLLLCLYLASKLHSVSTDKPSINSCCKNIVTYQFLMPQLMSALVKQHTKEGMIISHEPCPSKACHLLCSNIWRYLGQSVQDIIFWYIFLV